MIDKTKQIYSWWPNADIDIHCVCGRYIQVSCNVAEEPQTETCQNCGQKWKTALTVEMIEGAE